MTKKKKNLGIRIFMFVLCLCGMFSLQLPAFDFTPPYQDVDTWISGNSVVARIFDPSRRDYVQTSFASSSPSGLKVVRGVVHWVSAGKTVHYAVYDPHQGAWAHGSGGCHHLPQRWRNLA